MQERNPPDELATPTGTVDQPPKLTAKEAAFVRHFVQCLNASKAARLAGYSRRTCKEIAYQNFTKLHIQQAISAELDKQAMPPAEGIRRLTDWGRGSIEPFLDANGRLNMQTEQALENLHLIKKFEVIERTYGGSDGSTPIVERRTRIELHDAKDAVVQLLDVQGRFVQRVTNKHTVTVEGFHPIVPRADGSPEAPDNSA